MTRRAINISRRSAGGRLVPAGTVLLYDDFAGNAGDPVDSSLWAMETGRGQSGWGNNELQYFVADTNHVRLDGNSNCELVLTSSGAPDADSTRPYSSGKIISKKKFGAPCRIEGRVRFPTEPGTWPAFWTDARPNGWPAPGEIDIFEAPTWGDASAHSGAIAGVQKSIFMNTHQGQITAQTTDKTYSDSNKAVNTNWDLGTEDFINPVQNPKASNNINGITVAGVAGDTTGANLSRLAASLPANLAAAGFSTAVRYTSTSATAGARGMVWSSAWTTLSAIGAQAGAKLSFGVWCAASFADATHGPRAICQFYQGSTYLSQSNAPIITDPSGGFSYIENVTIPANCDNVHLLVQGTPAVAAVGQTVDGTGAIVVAGANLPQNGAGPQFADGDTPGWSWSGTANASASTVSGWHIYRVDWYASHIDFYFDGVKKWTADKDLYAGQGIAWPYDTWTHVVMAQFSFGGNYPGNPTITPVPWTSLSMKLDYIKVTAL